MKKIIFIRHGHRDRVLATDNGLSEKGTLQAQAASKIIFDRWQNLWGRPDVKILSSPKKRCQDTAREISNQLALKFKVDPLLCEARADETYGEFKTRIHKFLEKWKKDSAQVLIACSHSDWIPVAIDQLLQVHVSVQTAAFFEIDVHAEENDSHKFIYQWAPKN